MLDVNVFDFEIAHSGEGGAGVLVLVVTTTGADVLDTALQQLGYHVARGALG